MCLCVRSGMELGGGFVLVRIRGWAPIEWHRAGALRNGARAICAAACKSNCLGGGDGVVIANACVYFKYDLMSKFQQ